ncbi:hypothetical protein N656DRAFT_752331 [Canariomyces notabilis]|uniref:Uncharacterized protein n=1 Tax=Canariomyces notabilis TaxID=2074819 RepID=A0AAN6TG13_9PEZI|nr:hypothetical protein N656DRAFT_752331 [Canariomyces arenarius]
MGSGESTIITTTLTVSSNGRVEGWNDQPNSRGTMDIIWICLTTTFFCTYVVLSVNCPARGEPWWKGEARKLLWVAIGISGPEFILTAAAGQLALARDSVKTFRSAGYQGWTYRRAFFANMGGFELIPPDFPPFRINSKHIHWLVSRDYIDFPEVSDEELWDKSKQDTLTKAITCLQAGYLVLQCIGRAIQGLDVTTLELSTVAIVVSGPIAAHPYRQTPLDFVDDFTPSWALNIHRFMQLPVGRNSSMRPITRIGDSRLPAMTWKESSCLCLATFAYASVHMLGWNFSFPTPLEQFLWRISSSILVGTTVAFWIIESSAKMYRRRPLLGKKKSKTTDILPVQESSPEPKNPEEEVKAFVPKQLPLVWEFWGIFPISIIYAAARGYILIEAFYGLRSVRPSAYQEIEWLSVIPHL